MEFKEEINKMFEKIMTWFQINLLSQNLNRTYYMLFMSKTNYAVNVNLNYRSNRINNVYNTNSLGLALDTTLILETTYRPTYPQTEFSLLCN